MIYSHDKLLKASAEILFNPPTPSRTELAILISTPHAPRCSSAAHLP